MRSNTSIAPLASLAALARSLRSPTACCFSCGVVLFPVVSEKLPKSLKNLPPSFQNHPQNLPKSIRKPTKIRPKTIKKRDLEWIALRIAFVPRFFLGSGGVLGAFARLWGPTWSRLEASGGVLDPSWHDLAAVLGRPWGVLGCLGASWGRLGLDFRSNGEVDCGISSWMPFSNRYPSDFASKN